MSASMRELPLWQLGSSHMLQDSQRAICTEKYLPFKLHERTKLICFLLTSMIQLQEQEQDNNSLLQLIRK